MADEKPAVEGQEGEEQAPSSKKKLIILIALVVVVLAIAGAATVFLLGGDDEAAEEEPVEEVVLPALYLEVEPAMLATLTVEGRQRYMQVSLSVMARDQLALDAVDYHMPSIRSKLNTLYGGVDFKMAQTNEGKEALRGQTLELVNGVLEAEGEPLIEAVFFTNFVMQ